MTRRGRPFIAKAAQLVSLLCVPALLLSSCSGSGPVLSTITASTPNFVPGSHGIGKPPGVVEVHYNLGGCPIVTAKLSGPDNATLFMGSQEPGPHVLRFTGVISTSEQLGDAQLTRRVVREGDYTISIEAGGISHTVPVRVEKPVAAAEPPTARNLVVKPEAISPNSDAVDDVAEVTFRTAQTSTIGVYLTSGSGVRTPAFAPQEKGPGEQSVVVTGQDLAGNTLPDGAYTLAVQLDNRLGERTISERPFTINGSGQPSIEIVKVQFSPQQITLGSTIAVSVTVRNTGNVPLRTQGPDPGYTYDTNSTYASIEGNKYVDKAGLWRVGVDWDGNTGGGPYRYPFRWGFGKTLMPGETVVTGGNITILKQERRMWFYAGVLQEGIRIVLDRLGRTPIDVSF